MYSLLIADDEPGIRAIVRKYAEFEGNRVIEAADGMQAVNLCRSENPDIVVMDIMMPELDGFSAVREIRKFSQVPIIMLSARGEEYDKINGFCLGADDYVVKPFSPKELLLRVEVILKRGSQRQPVKGEIEHDIVEMDGGRLKVDLTARIAGASFGLSRDRVGGERGQYLEEKNIRRVFLRDQHTVCSK